MIAAVDHLLLFENKEKFNDVAARLLEAFTPLTNPQIIPFIKEVYSTQQSLSAIIHGWNRRTVS